MRLRVAKKVLRRQRASEVLGAAGIVDDWVTWESLRVRPPLYRPATLARARVRMRRRRDLQTRMARQTWKAAEAARRLQHESSLRAAMPVYLAMCQLLGVAAGIQA